MPYPNGENLTLDWESTTRKKNGNRGEGERLNVKSRKEWKRSPR